MRRSDTRELARTSRWLPAAAESLFILAIVTAAGRLLRLNATSVGILFFLAVLFIASRRPLVMSTTAALIAALALNYFFLPPTGTFVVADPSNWVALASFLVACIVANRLLVRERRQSERAEASRSEVQALYSLSVEALRAMGGLETIGEAAVRAVRTIGARAGGLVLFGNSPQQQRLIAWSGDPMGDEVEDVIAGVGRHRRYTEIPSAYGRDVFVPLNVGEKIVGVLVARGTEATRDGLESSGTLLSLVLERERFVTERAHVEALRETNELQNALLQAVSHDLNSPMTVLSLESEALMRSVTKDESSSHAAVIREQTAQLQHRINNLLSLARYRAGVVNPKKEPTPPADIFLSAREHLSAIVQSRPIRTTIEPDTPDVMVDPSLALEIMVNLIENAHRASPSDSPIELRALVSPDDASRVRIEVADRGRGLTGAQQKAIRTVSFSDSERRGLGIEVARMLAMLSGGSLEWFARDGGGTLARLDIPAAGAAVEESR